ncbi:hypothetical protein [Dysgonomonas sp. HGC4]|uniref:hypothetical protein n=1 Tax=Dysgonomonas sp. HGC4 TaxID=1658009 RepID=UPI0006802DD5|nr:hypothetical protein [Dysgonomonas sp. HGC4]MBD8348962.1 hypothetical protein [Dysgonomonas sp. HGC4]
MIKDNRHSPILDLFLKSINPQEYTSSDYIKNLILDLVDYSHNLLEIEHVIHTILEKVNFIECECPTNDLGVEFDIVEILSNKGYKTIDYYFNNFEYPKAISKLANLRFSFEGRLLELATASIFKLVYENQIACINDHLHRLWTLQREQIKAKTYNRQGKQYYSQRHQTLDIIDAIGAYMVYPKSEADSILSHIGVAYDDSLMYRMEVLLSDCYIDHNGDCGIPFIYIKNSNIEIDILTKQLIDRNLKSNQFGSNSIILTSYLDSSAVNDIILLEEKIYLLFNNFNSEISKIHIHIFISTLQKKNIHEFGYGEAIYVRTLLIETIKANKDLNRKFILLLYFLKYDKDLSTDIFCVRNVTKFIEVLSDYFPESTSLSYDSIKSYLTRKDRVSKNFKDFGLEIGNICHFPSDFIEKHRTLLNSVE